MKAALAACAIALSGCETIKINGVEIEPGEQVAWSLVLATVAAAAFYLADEGVSDPVKTKCKRLTEAGDCSIPLDEAN